GLVFNLSGNLIVTEAGAQKAQQIISTAFGRDPFRLGELREALGVSRKIALMWAEILDSRNITRRDGENRLLV
ncbi:MAG: SelB C-terminal domain-containing protein, partial [Candidatus Fermentibacteria bacterium]|nr:SelB C-terminal domain-containing protein [Candidatus Fermentibacteria bacterium]